MVKYWHFCLLSATSCLLLSTDNLDANVLSSISSESSKHHSHIHTLSHLDLSHFSPNLFLKQSGYQSYRMASVCFITDAGNCSGQEFGNLETPDGTNRPDYDTIPEQCRDAGYTKTSCPAGQHLVNSCPSDNRYYERCECNENLTEICNIPYYGVGLSCDGKYEKCERDNDRACKEEGYPLTGSCPTLQVPNRRCPYDSNYYDKCVCQSGLISCPSPQIGVGSSCGGKYQSCQCPSNYKFCDCGPAVGASSCTINGKTTYSDCKACCDDTCPSGYSKSYPGGCYDTSRTDCGNTCYKSKDCCDDTCPSGYSKTKSSECYDTSSTGCGNTCYKAKACCVPYASETNCSYGTTTASDGCGGTRTICKEEPECTYGYIYYSDKTCKKEYDNTKTPIGVVVYDENNEKWIMSLQNYGFQSLWAKDRVDISAITNYTTEQTAVNDLKSCENTKAMLAISTTRYPAAADTMYYAPDGAENTEGQWCLPALGIWNMVNKHRSKIDDAITRTGGRPLIDYYWSSTEYSSDDAWEWGSRGIFLHYSKVNNFAKVRPVLKIQ